MGEAKRRRMRAREPVLYLDPVTNEMKTARNAGDPVRFLAELEALHRDEALGRRPSVQMDCNTCTACCYYKEVDFDPKFERAADLAALEFDRTDDGRAKLKKRKDGSCVHLGPSGCTVYDHRPRPCRLYDCRGYSACGVVDAFDGGRRSPVWLFDPDTEKGRLVKHAFQMLGMMYQRGEHERGNKPLAADVLAFALTNMAKTVEMLTAMSKLSPEEIEQITGVDPRTVTAEDQAAFMRAVVGGMPTIQD